MSLNGVYPIFQKWAIQTCWILSDTHFSDKELKHRPSDEIILNNINSCVGKKDTVIILGDVGNLEYIKKIRAFRKILIMGNHDAGRTNYERKIYKKLYNKSTYSKEEALNDMSKHYSWETYKLNVCDLQEGFWEVHADNCLFDEVYEGPLVIGEKLILSHEPLTNVNWAFNLHGHVHSKAKKNDNLHYNFCLEAIDYKPINLNQWLKDGHTSKVQTIHRTTIDKATKRKRNKNDSKRS